MTKRGNEQPYTSEPAPMEQVRELLFGTQLKEMETRFQRQEERLQREINESRETMKKRLDSLENFMRSETASLLHRIKEEKAESEAILKSEQRDRAEAVKNEQRERLEAIKNEQRERNEAVKNEQRERTENVTQLTKELSVATELFERKLAKVAGTLDIAEQELRRLLLSESGSLADKVEGKYHEALAVIATTAAEIRQDMVTRSGLAGMFTETAVKLSGHWTTDMSQLIAPHSTNGQQGKDTSAMMGPPHDAKIYQQHNDEHNPAGGTQEG